MTSRDYHKTMKKVRIAEFKARLSEYLRAVRRGNELTIFDRDQPIARVSPFDSSGALVVRERSPQYRKPSDVPMPPPIRLHADPVSLLLEDRQSEV